MFNMKKVSDAVVEYDKVNLEEMGGYEVKSSLKLKIRDKWHIIYERNFGHIYQLSGDCDYNDYDNESDNWITLFASYEDDFGLDGDRPYVERLVEIEYVSDKHFINTADMKRLISIVSCNNRALEL